MFSKYALNWLNLLEKEYDREFVTIDAILQNEVDSNKSFIVIRKGLCAMIKIWSQLCHKVQTIFHLNAKLEGDVAELKAKVTEAEATIKVLESQLRAALLELQLLKLKDLTANKKQLEVIENELLGAAKSDLVDYDQALNDAKVKQLEAENEKLGTLVLNLQSEIFGNRLITSYLEQELSGRVQQLQISSQNLNVKDHDRLWQQIESEIQLNRHKTLIKAAKGALTNKDNLILDLMVFCSSKMLSSKKQIFRFVSQHQLNTVIKGPGFVFGKTIQYPPSSPRKVQLSRDNKKHFGFSISGGMDYSLPIIVSEVLKDGCAFNLLYVGDKILKANGHDVSDYSISQFAQLLETIGDTLELEVSFIDIEKRENFADEDIDEIKNDGSALEYPFVIDENIHHGTNVEDSLTY